jgi:L-histidine Nalpha-methyltransferase
MRTIGDALGTLGASQNSTVMISDATLPRPSSAVLPKAENMLRVNNSIDLVESAFSQDVVDGLSADVKTLPSRWLYDERGSALFEEITKLDEYYLTRAETSILRERQGDIADFVGSDAILVEYGAGAGVKTELVLAGLRDPRGYVPIDIAEAFLAETSKRIASRFPSLWVRPIERNFLDVFEVPFDGSGGRRTGSFPGSTMGNLNAIEAQSLLSQMGRHLGNDGRAIIGVDLQKNVNTLLRAYNDSAGVTAAFNLKLLERIVAFLVTASRGAGNGNNNRLSTRCPEVISLGGVAKSFSRSWSN